MGRSAENEDANGFSVAPGSVLATDFGGSMLPSEGLEETAKTKEVEEAGGKEVVREEEGYQAEEASGVKTAMAFAPAEMAIDKLGGSRAWVYVPVTVMNSVDDDESPASPFATCALISANREETAEDVATVSCVPYYPHRLTRARYRGSGHCNYPIRHRYSARLVYCLQSH